MTNSDQHLEELSVQIGKQLMERGEVLTTAESCTGGWVSQVVTAIAGSSNWFDCGFVTYSNAAKADMLGVSKKTIVTHGAVSEPVVIAMAQGALQHSRAHWALAISGVAGPAGGTPEKPVGTVCFAWAGPAAFTACETMHFPGDRETVRRASVAHALRGLLQRFPPMLA
ncbi:MAG: nicotinamide-nucleotide amidase [Zoogloeaceae bacterium]|nr:nicotinamide-nucleotide amidase [Zoogloeaceae bacterium]